MKKARNTESQILFAFKQVETKQPIADVFR